MSGTPAHFADPDAFRFEDGDSNQILDGAMIEFVRHLFSVHRKSGMLFLSDATVGTINSGDLIPRVKRLDTPNLLLDSCPRGSS